MDIPCNRWILILQISILILFPTVVRSHSISMRWDETEDPDLAGYHFYIGTDSRDYTNMIDLGPVTTYTVTGLEEGPTYYFAVTAYNTSDDESDYSNEVSYYVGQENEIVLLSPDGGEIIPAGSTQVIEWEVNSFIRKIRIWLSIDAGETWSIVKGVTHNDGSYSWLVPDVTSEQCLIRIEEYGKGIATVVSEGFFSIQGGGLNRPGSSEGELPKQITLEQNYPNPFNPMTMISFGVPPDDGETGPRSVSLTVYDSRGRVIRNLIESQLMPGVHSVSWDGKTNQGETTTSGIYFYVLRVEDEVHGPRKMMLSR